MPLIRYLDDVAVLVFHRRAARCGEWVQDGVQLGAHGVAEFAVQLPHAVPPLFEFEMAPVLLQSIIDRFGAVGIGGSDDGLGEPL